MKFGKASFYADENIENYLIDYLRKVGHRVDSAVELGLESRDDRFHLQEARRRKRILLTRDKGYLDHRKFPFHDLKNTCIVILRTEDKENSKIDFGYMLINLIKEVGASGNKNLHKMKIEIQGPKVVLYAKTRGRIRIDTIDISKPLSNNKELFKD